MTVATVALFAGALHRAPARALTAGAHPQPSWFEASGVAELGGLRLPDPGRPEPVVTPPAAGTPYDQAQELTIHNAYERPMSIGAQLGAGVRSLEIDVHATKRGRVTRAGDWYVYHVDLPTLDRTQCDRLSSCLDAIAAFHRAHPAHAPMTIFVDLKDDFGPGHRPADLDRMLVARLGRGAMVTPADLTAACPSATNASGAVRTCGFPTVAALRGRVLFALTGGGACQRAGPEAPLRAYAKERRRVAFIAPSLNNRCDLSATRRDAPATVFFNMDFAHRAEARAVGAAGLSARIYYGLLAGGLDLPAAFEEARATGATFLATDRLDWVPRDADRGTLAMRSGDTSAQRAER